MFKKITSLLITLSLMAVAMPVMAENEPETKTEINAETVAEEVEIEESVSEEAADAFDFEEAENAAAVEPYSDEVTLFETGTKYDNYLYYQVNSDGTAVSITDCDSSATGEIDIPSEIDGLPVTSIGHHAFYGCSGLTSITIPDSVTSIGDYTFYNCSGLTSVTIPDSVTSIGDDAFYNCRGLTSITIPDSVTSIGSDAFEDCRGLTSVTIPDSVTSIGYRAFYDCSSLTSVTIGNSVTSIGKYAFYDCSGLTSITIPDSVTSIGDYAFSGCRGLTSITIPDGVTSIDYCAFSSCSGLTSVTIPDSVTSIDYCAFSGCSGLTSVTIGNSVTSIGYRAFYDCSGLTSVYITDIDAWSRINFDGITANPMYYAENLYINGTLAKNLNIVIPDDITDITATFYGWKCITNVTIPNSVTTIGDYAFYGCGRLTSINIPDSVTTIGDYAFYNCSGLTSVTIPNSVTSIGSNAFYNCSSLTDVYITDIDAWSRINFYGRAANPMYYAKNLYINGTLAKNLNVVIPDGITDITATFYRWRCITSVTIPDSVTSIGEYAFYGCSGLTSITIPDSVTSIGYYAFEGCSGLTSVTIPDSVTSIGNYAFRGCSGLTSITIPDSVTSIGYYAFEDCSSLTSITIPDSVTSIGNYAFRDCSSLTSITIPDSVTSIGDYAFSGCSGLTTVNFNAINCTSMGRYDFPVFKDCTALTTVNIGEKVTNIPKYAFRGCSGLTYVSMTDSVTSIGDYAFSGTKIFIVYYNGTQDDWDYILFNWDNGNLENAIVLFGGDPNVEVVVKSGDCGNGATWTLTNLGKLTISGKGTMTDYDYDYYYSNTPWKDYINVIKTVEIENGITNIGRYAFYNSSNLKNVLIPKSITSIGGGAFYSCGNLTDIYYAGNQTQWKKTSGYDTVPSNAIIHYDTADIPEYRITFVNYDNSVLQQDEVIEGTMPQYAGSTPSKPSDDRYTYTFSGWSPTLTEVTKETTYKAQFKSEPRQYTVTLNTNGGIINSDEITSYKYGIGAVLPTDLTKDGYVFDGWYENESCMGREIAEITKSDIGGKTYWARWRTPIDGVEVPVVNVSETDDIWSFEVTLEKTYEYSYVYALAYDENGQLLGLNKVDLETEGSTTIELTKPNAAVNELKVFVWTDKMQPITTVWEKSI